MDHRVTIVDVAPRDGIQNEARMLTAEQKIELIRRLRAAGVCWMEATSFVSPKWVPQMADADEVLRAVKDLDGIRPIVLVLNGRGYERAVAAGARYIRLVVAVTETMNMKNANASPANTMATFRPLIEHARREGIDMTGMLAVSFGCAYEGAVDPEQVFALAAQYAEAGVNEIDFADTVGMAVPSQVERVLARARREFPGIRLGIHLHNTRGVGLANAHAALKAGVDIIDASTGGAGGCPFAPRATGNIPTDDLVFMLEGMGIRTGIDLKALVEVSHWFEAILGHPLPAMVPKAGPCWSRPPPLA